MQKNAAATESGSRVVRDEFNETVAELRQLSTT